MTNRLLLRTVNSISHVKYNKILQSCNKPVRIRLLQLINAVRTELAVEEVKDLGNV